MIQAGNDVRHGWQRPSRWCGVVARVGCMAVAVSAVAMPLTAEVTSADAPRVQARRAWEPSLRLRLAPFLAANFPESAERWWLRIDDAYAAPPGDHEIVLDEARIDRMRRFADALAYATVDTAVAKRLKDYARALRAETGEPRTGRVPDYAAFAAIDRGAFDRALAEPVLKRARNVLLRDAIDAAIVQQMARVLLGEGSDARARPRDADALAYAMIVASRPESNRGQFPGFMVAALFDEGAEGLDTPAFACRLFAVLRHESGTGAVPVEERPVADAAPGRGAAALRAFIEPPLPGCELSWPALPMPRQAP